MSRRLDLLIRIQKQILDERRRRVLQLEGQLFGEIEKLKQLNLEVTQEKQFTASHVQASYTWRQYLKKAQEREKAILHFIDQLNRNIVWEKKNIQSLFEKLKAYEIAKEKILEEHRIQENKQEQYFLDEIGLTQYMRNKD